jgi:Flp pilus assembly protein TadB
MVASFFGGVPLLPAFGFAFAGIRVAALAARLLKKRREAKFLDALPDAVDVIVRGIKAGLPLFESIKVVAADSPNRCAANSTPSSRPRPSACRSVKPASAFMSECRFRRRTSSVS